MIIKQYRINPDWTYGGMEESFSDVDIDISQYLPPKGFTFIGPENESYIWDGEAWTEPPAPYVPTIEELKELKIDYISNSFEKHVSGRTTVSLGWDMQFNQRDIVMVDGAVRFLEMTNGTEGYLTDADNVNHYNLTLAAMKQALLEMTQAYLQAHAHKQQLRDLVAVTTTAEGLEGIVWLL